MERDDGDVVGYGERKCGKGWKRRVSGSRCWRVMLEGWKRSLGEW